MNHRFRAELFLILATVLWGATFPVLAELLHYMDAAWIVGIRFTVSALAMLPLISRHFLERMRQSWRAGGILAILTFAGFYLQTVGLIDTSPARSAFITQLLLLYVLVIQIIFLRKRPTLWNYVSTFLLLAGAWILVRPEGGEINRGDVITFLSAGAFGAYIIQIDRTRRENGLGGILFVQFTLCAISGLGLALARDVPAPRFTGFSGGLIFYLAIPASVFTTWIMLRFQPETTPVRASILYALEPVFATLITMAYPGIWPTTHEWIGGAIILSGVLTSELSGYIGDRAFLVRRKTSR